MMWCVCVFSYRLSYCHDVVDVERCVLCRGTVYRLQAPHDVGHGCGLVAQETGDCLLGLQRGHVGSADRLGLGAELLEAKQMGDVWDVWTICRRSNGEVLWSYLPEESEGIWEKSCTGSCFLMVSPLKMAILGCQDCGWEHYPMDRLWFSTFLRRLTRVSAFLFHPLMCICTRKNRRYRGFMQCSGVNSPPTIQ